MDKDLRKVLLIALNFVVIGFVILYFTKGCS
jgi:hypothetical protein